jgi:hypothetical protein
MTWSGTDGKTRRRGRGMAKAKSDEKRDDTESSSAGREQNQLCTDIRAIVMGNLP